jgi:hypothetical protein
MTPMPFNRAIVVIGVLSLLSWIILILVLNAIWSVL